MLTRLQVVGLLVLALASRASAQQVLVVAPVGTAGADFNSVQAAVDAAADGDTLLILPGDYGEDVVIRNLGLVLAGVVGPGGERASLHSLIIGLLGATDSVMVRGLRLAPSLASESLAVLQCAGAVEFEDCVVDDTLSVSCQPQRVEESDHVVFTRCTLRGTQGKHFTQFVAGGTALQAINSSVALYDCDVTGGPGEAALSLPPPAILLMASVGGFGAMISGGTILVAGGTIRGGTGGDGVTGFLCAPPASGGPAVLNSSFMRRLDSTLIGGAPGAMQGCGPAAAPGEALVGPGNVTFYVETLRHLVVSSPVEPGGSVSLDVTGLPSEPLLLLQSLAPLGTWNGGLKGTLAGAPPYLVVPLGITSPAGTLHLDVTLPADALPPGYPSLLLMEQLVTAADYGGGLLSEPSMLVLVDDIP